MYITDTWPVKVNGFAIRFPPDDLRVQQTVRVSDAASMIALRMDNQAVVNLAGYAGTYVAASMLEATRPTWPWLQVSSHTAFLRKIQFPIRSSYCKSLCGDTMSARGFIRQRDTWRDAMAG